MFFVLVFSIIISFSILEVIMQNIFDVIPLSSGLYSIDLIDLTFWLIPIFSLIVLVFGFVFMVFPFRPKGQDYYMEDDR